MLDQLISFIRDHYQTNENIPLHSPIFKGNEKKYLLNAIDSTFVSSIGAYVEQFEREIAEYTHSPSAVVTMNGTSALHAALLLSGVQPQDYVITQPLTFVATCNAISYCHATPIFVDVDQETLGLSSFAVFNWLEEHAYLDDSSICRYKPDNRIIRTCVPMHTFGHPVKLDELMQVCEKWGISIVEDAAESLGSLYKGRHTGTIGQLGILSFNGNKIITTGGGGMILSNKDLGQKAKHLTTTAKIPHAWEFHHDAIGFNYRMPNINAALGCAQLEQLDRFIENKRALANKYQEFFKHSDFQFVHEPSDCRSNYWLNAVICENKTERDKLLNFTNQNGVMTRPAWELMNHFEMFHAAPHGLMQNAEWLSNRIINLPSSVVKDYYANSQLF